MHKIYWNLNEYMKKVGMNFFPSTSLTENIKKAEYKY